MDNNIFDLNKFSEYREGVNGKYFSINGGADVFLDQLRR